MNNKIRFGNYSMLRHRHQSLEADRARRCADAIARDPLADPRSVSVEVGQRLRAEMRAIRIVLVLTILFGAALLWA